MAPEMFKAVDEHDGKSRRIPTLVDLEIPPPSPSASVRPGRLLAGKLGALAKLGGGPVVGGRVLEVSGLVVRISGFPVRVGDVVELDAGADGALPCEVVGFRGDDLLAVPLGASRTITPGAPVWRCGARSQ